jgi:hypothetical protein
MPTFGSMPSGDVTLADGRVLQKAASQPPMVGWICPTDGLQVVASMDRTPPDLRYLHISVGYNARGPTQEDIRLCRQAFFGDLPISDSQLKDVYTQFPHFFHMRYVGWRGTQKKEEKRKKNRKR